MFTYIWRAEDSDALRSLCRILSADSGALYFTPPTRTR